MCAERQAHGGNRRLVHARRTRPWRPIGPRKCRTARTRWSAARRDDGRYALPGLTSIKPPHNVDRMPSCGATAARRTEPGVCAVPGSNAAGPTMRIGEYSVGMSHRLVAQPKRLLPFCLCEIATVVLLLARCDNGAAITPEPQGQTMGVRAPPVWLSNAYEWIAHSSEAAARPRKRFSR
jgi:hypothetical protein